MKNELKKFKKAAIKQFHDLLISKGFKPKKRRIEDWSCEIVYTASDDRRYVGIESSMHPRDYPYFFNVVLGEGSLDWPEADWNGIALWRIINLKTGENKAKEYNLSDGKQIEDLMIQSRNDFEKYCIDFLDGNLESFYAARKKQNTEREPYKIHKPTSDGKYTIEYDKVSEKLKKKFS